jgi:hypothetical protein
MKNYETTYIMAIAMALLIVWVLAIVYILSDVIKVLQ